MATKKFIIEVEEGVTINCADCPLDYIKCARTCFDVIDCDVINLATMKIKELEENNDTSRME